MFVRATKGDVKAFTFEIGRVGRSRFKKEVTLYLLAKILRNSAPIDREPFGHHHSQKYGLTPIRS
jgi:hypothetical protein